MPESCAVGHGSPPYLLASLFAVRGRERSVGRIRIEGDDVNGDLGIEGVAVVGTSQEGLQSQLAELIQRDVDAVARGGASDLFARPACFAQRLDRHALARPRSVLGHELEQQTPRGLALAKVPPSAGRET